MAKKSTYITGYCAIGAHEGQRPKFAGKPAKTCEQWAERTDPRYGKIPACTCSCHDEVTKLYVMSGMERVTADNPEYKVPRSPYIMPDPLEIALSSSDGPDTAAAPQIVRPATPLAPMVPRAYAETPTGKRARGQLEDEVLAICGSFVRGELEEEILTPSVIANMIDPDDPPSVGAIGAVFDRWVKLGFANCAKRPVRFESFTLLGMEKGLDWLKAKAKRERRQTQTKQNLGLARLN